MVVYYTYTPSIISISINLTSRMAVYKPSSTVEVEIRLPTIVYLIFLASSTLKSASYSAPFAISIVTLPNYIVALG